MKLYLICQKNDKKSPKESHFNFERHISIERNKYMIYYAKRHSNHTFQLSYWDKKNYIYFSTVQKNSEALKSDSDTCI